MCFPQVWAVSVFEVALWVFPEDSFFFCALSSWLPTRCWAGVAGVWLARPSCAIFFVLRLEEPVSLDFSFTVHSSDRAALCCVSLQLTSGAFLFRLAERTDTTYPWCSDFGGSRDGNGDNATTSPQPIVSSSP